MKKRVLIILVLCVAMFAWIFLAVALTGGREIDEMTGRDLPVMAGFVIAEVLTVLSLCVILRRFGKEDGGKPEGCGDGIKPEQRKLTKAERARFLRGVVIWVAAMALSILAVIPGALLRKRMGEVPWALGLRLGCYVLGIVLPVCSWLGERLYRGHYTHMDVTQKQTFLLSHREQAEQTADAKRKKLRLIRWATDSYALLLLFLGLALGACNGMLKPWEYLFSPFLIQLFFQQIPFPEPKAVLAEANDRLPEAGYPQLYALAEEAARESGWEGKVCLCITPVCSASIGLVRNTAVVSVGAICLGLLTREELHMVFLHEFAHVTGENKAGNREADYLNFLARGRNPNFLSTLSSATYYALPDAMYAMEWTLYQYAASLCVEQRADNAMAQNPKAAAASLLKLTYYDLYRWEAEATDRKPEYESGADHVVSQELECFLRAMPDRVQDWNAIVQREILARNATHPTTWGRIQAFGLKTLPETNEMPTGDYAAECTRAVELTDEKIADYFAPSYEAERQANYVQPLERINAWIASGSPLTAEGYADIVEDLQHLNRISEAVALCQRAIAELPPIAAAFAYFTRGRLRLHQYNAAGLSDLYTAVELNSNYVDQALDEIGTFCCLAGMQQELDTYRERALELMRKQEMESSQIDTLSRRDKLSQEHLPDGMLEQILAYIQSISQDSIAEIYLVRKTVTDTFFTSAFIIRFRPQIQQSIHGQVLHQIFRYLDTCSDWQFSLFDYAEVPRGLAEHVPESCVFRRNDG